MYVCMYFIIEVFMYVRVIYVCSSLCMYLGSSFFLKLFLLVVINVCMSSFR